MPDFDSKSQRRLRRLSLLNVSRMGHCAPSIMQTLLDASGVEARWLVQLTAGLPGGIGNTGAECGGVTAPLLLLGLRQPRERDRKRLPLVVYQGHELVQRFTACQGTLSCREIRGERRLPLPCLGVIQRAPALYARAVEANASHALSPEEEAADLLLHAHWVEQDFHCAWEVLQNLGRPSFAHEDVLRASSGFLGGMAFTGNTCCALTAGVMALGLALGSIEDSRLRVLRMLGKMAVGADAFADHLNAFNRIMNLGHELAAWFSARFGSTRCRTISGCDFCTLQGARAYIDGGGTARCRALAGAVAARVRDLVRDAEASRP